MTILSLVESPERRGAIVAQLAQRVCRHYCQGHAIERIYKVYESILHKELASTAA
jgi:hypothetical protein